MLSLRLRDGLALLLVVILCTGCRLPVDDEWEDYQRSVIRILADDGQTTSAGTAFSINEQGHYVSNYHVASMADDGELTAIESTTPLRLSHDVEVIWSDQAKDLAILYIPDWTNPGLPLHSGNNVRINEPVLSIGFPGSSDILVEERSAAWTVPTLKRGIISERIDAVRGSDRVPWALYEHSAVVNSGNSGGPLVDECGRVLGINVVKATSSVELERALERSEATGRGRAQIDIQEGAYFAIRSGELAEILSAVKIPYTLDKARCLGELAGSGLLFWVAGSITGALLVLLSLAVFLLIRRQRPDPEVGPLPPASAGYQTVDSNFVGMADPEARTLQCSVAGVDDTPLNRGRRYVLGRDPNLCDVVVLHESVSRQHACVYVDAAGDVSVEDLDSAAGTTLDNTSLRSSQGRLSFPEGAIVQLGVPEVCFRVVRPTA